MQSSQDNADSMAACAAEIDIKQEVMEFEESIEELMTDKKEDFQIKDDPDEIEIKYVNTQDYLDIGETVVSEPNRAAPDVTTSPGQNMQSFTKKNNNKSASCKVFKCDICGHHSKRLDVLKIHKRIHTEEKPYKCDVCDYCTKYKSTLRDHMKSHSGDKPHKCGVCDYSCKYGSNLKIHMRTHSREKPYKCEICDYRATQTWHLKNHMRTHSKEKPYKCDICDHRAAVSGSLKIHMRTHSREKPYKCKICDYSAAQTSTLKTHMKIHSKEKHTNVIFVTTALSLKPPRSYSIKRKARIGIKPGSPPGLGPIDGGISISNSRALSETDW